MRNGSSSLIGIDLGTYNSAACVLMGSRPVLLRPEEGATEQGMCFPSVVEFDESGKLVQAGERARRSLPIYPQSVVWGVKRLIGKSYAQADAAGDIRRYGYRIEKDPDGGCMIRIGSQSYTPRQITTFILEKIKHDAEADFNPIGESVEEAVITVPAYFNPVQKHETEQAALAAGFRQVYLLPEPTAAASAYRLKVQQEDQYVVVVDLGAGTLDVTVALLYLDDNGQLPTVEKSHGGDTALGGLDMDDTLVECAVRRHGLRRIMNDPQAKARLRVGLERAKIELSTAGEAEVAFTSQRGPVRFTLTRSELEVAVEPVVKRCLGPIHVAISEANLSPDDVSHVLLVGGPTMMPLVRRTIIEAFRSNTKVVQELEAIDSKGFPANPMEVVAHGSVLGVAGRVAPHGYGMLISNHYTELLSRRQRYPARGSIGLQYWGSEKTIDFGLVQQSLDAEGFREEYNLLGMFQFDCVPRPGALEFRMDWEYTENGVLHLEVQQAGAGLSLPLYDVSRLLGNKIAKPVSLIPQQKYTHAAPPSYVERASWTRDELRHAVQFGEKVLACGRERADRAPNGQHERIRELCGRLEGWLKSEEVGCDLRTPRIRDLGRALLSLLHVSRLINGSELAALQEDL